MTQKSAALLRFSVSPIRPGRWWVMIPPGELIENWVDALAEEAQKQWLGRVAVLDSAATLISNLRVWENLILPVWRRDNVSLAALEESVNSAFDIAQIAQTQRERLVMQLPAALDKSERRLVILLRSVLIDPACVIIESDQWRELTARSQDSPHTRLFAGLQESDCLIVLGSSPALAGFEQVEIVERG